MTPSAAMAPAPIQPGYHAVRNWRGAKTGKTWSGTPVCHHGETTAFFRYYSGLAAAGWSVTTEKRLQEAPLEPLA